MTDRDTDDFGVLFQRLRTIFPLRADPVELQQITALYFKVLRRHPIGVVEVAMDRWLEVGTRFPKPAEWLDSVAKRVGREGLTHLSDEEAREHKRAAALGYEDEPCRCVVCVGAGVSHRYLRYVADVDANGEDVRRQLDDTVVPLGHWAHGEELRRWYVARDEFQGLEAKMFDVVLKPMPRVTGQQIAAEDRDVVVAP